MTRRIGLLTASVIVAALFLFVQLGALALVEPMIEADRQFVEDPDNPGVTLLVFLAVILATGGMLAAFRYGSEWVVRATIVGVSGMLAWIVLATVLPPVSTALTENDPAAAGAVVVMASLLVHPEWYVIDTAGILMGAGAAGLFGISIGILPILLLLVVLAVYDAISVYRTRHMLSLAEGVMELRIPVVLVAPTTPSYSYRSMEEAPTEGTDPGDRDALFVGLGDAVIPTMLVASAAAFVEAPDLPVPIVALNLPALGAMVGTLVGLTALLALVLRGRPHAGLPLLNGGAILGYLLGALAVGLSLPGALGL